jgi:anti-sigma regulatory factor (Ser/Thr protein kinase)
MTGMVPVAVRVFPGQPSQSRQVRHWVSALITAAGLSVADAELAAGELFANAIRHTRSGIQPGGKVTVAVTADGAVHVHDQGDGTGAPGTRMTALVPGNDRLPVNGRGLLIVAALSATWGYLPASQCPAAGPDDPAAPSGCCVWFRLPPAATVPARDEDRAYASA